MGIFSRKQRTVARLAPAKGALDDYIGRKFRSSLSMQECLDNFSAVKDECYRAVGPLREVGWEMPVGLPERTSQGSVPEVPPVRVLAIDLVDGGQSCLAVWDPVVSYGGRGW